MKINNYIGNFQLSSIFKKNSENNPATAKITELSEKFKNENNLIDIIKIFNKDKALKIQSPSTYVMDNYKFIIGTKENIQDYKKTLTMLNKLDITSCPRIEKTAINKNKQYTMLVLKLPENEAKMKSFVKNQKKIDTLAKCKFISDLETIAKKENYYNTLIPEDLNVLKVTSDGQIFITDWNFMDKFTNNVEQSQYFNQLRKLFNLVLY